MPSIIDQLIVELGLDSSDFTKGIEEAIASFRRTGGQMESVAKNAEASARRTTQFFADLRREVIGRFAAFTAGQELRSFTANITEADANVGRFARTLGMSTEELSAWQGVADRTGGSADSITSSMLNFSNQLEQQFLTGQGHIQATFNNLGIETVDRMTGKFKTAVQLVRELAAAYSAGKLGDPSRANAILRSLGADQSIINLVLLGKRALNERLEQQRQISVVTDEDWRAAMAWQDAMAGLGQAAENVGRDIKTWLTPHVVGTE